MKNQPQSKYLKRRRLRFLPLYRSLNLFPGEFPSTHKGEGEDFVDLRLHQHSDDAKRIHWPQYAKTRELFVIERMVPKNLTIILAVDLSKSMSFSEQKLETVDTFFEILIGSLVLSRSNSLGLLGFSAGVERYFPPRIGRTHFAQLLRWYLKYTPQESLTDIPKALHSLIKKAKPRSIVFFVSDFFEEQDFSQGIKVAARNFDFIPVVIRDPKEFALLPGTRIAYKDSETGKEKTLWLTQKKVEDIRTLEKVRQEKLASLFRYYRLEPIFLESSDTKTIVQTIHRFFERRDKLIKGR